MKNIIALSLGLLMLPVVTSASESVPTLKDIRWSLPGEWGDVSFYGQDRARWQFWDYFGSEPFDNTYDFFTNQLRLGTRLENIFFKTHAAWQYSHVGPLPSGTSAGAGAGSLYFANGTAEKDTHGTYLKYAELHTKDLAGAGLTVGGGRMDYASGNRYLSGTGKIQTLKSTRISERLLGGFGWSEYQRSFDGGYGAWDHEIFNGQVAAMNPTQGGFDENAGRTLYEIDLLASEVTLKKGNPFPNTELQFFYYRYADSRQMSALTARRDNTDRVVPAGNEYDLDIETFGAHLVGAADAGEGIADYLIWGGYQRGDWF